MLARLLSFLRSGSRREDRDVGSPAFEVTESVFLGVPLFSLWGALDRHDAINLAERIRGRLGSRDRYLLLGLGHLESVSSGGVRLFAALAEELAEGGWLGLINPNHNVLRILETTGLTDMEGVRFFEKSEDAFAALREEGRKPRGRPNG